MSELRVVYGATCTWWDTIDCAGRTPPDAHGHSMPCCPHCGSVLYEGGSVEHWWRGIDDYDAKQPGYQYFMRWLRGRCFRSYAIANEAFDQDHT